ncbi:MAG: PIN domain-containing protein [Thermoleophilia bacterium]|nr:PIN domain-containing protein [Thermoleophilia bacterium]
MTASTFFLDANIFLRFLTEDDRQKAEACRRLVQKAVAGELTLTTHPLILAEVVWVLESYYKLTRGEIAAKLELIFNTPNLVVFEASIFARAVEYYSNSSLDLADCFAAALAVEKNSALVSYDRDFTGLEELLVHEPEELV